MAHTRRTLRPRSVVPGVPLWQLVLAAQAVDIRFSVLAVAGLEGAAITPDEVPRQVVTAGHYTHSLLMSAVYLVACVNLGAAFK